MTSARQIFEKLAHSSIMKLNATSMGKLFDLMVMGLKHQVMLTTSPEEVYHLTMTHLTTIGSIIKGSPSEVLVNDTINLFKNMTQTYKAYDYIIIKQSLLRFLQEKHIKVSLMIQDNIQSLDGTIHLNFAEEGVIYSQ